MVRDSKSVFIIESSKCSKQGKDLKLALKFRSSRFDKICLKLFKCACVIKSQFVWSPFLVMNKLKALKFIDLNKTQFEQPL